jgi:two-component system sensor histidine kinase/response regulator
MHSPRLPLRQRLTLSLMLVGLASLLLAGVVYIAFDLVSRRTQIEDRLEFQAQRIADDCAAQDFPKELDPNRPWSRTLADDRYVRSAQLMNADGEVLGWYESENSPGSGYGSHPHEASLIQPFVCRNIRIDGLKVGTVCVEGNSKLLWERLGSDVAILLVLTGVSSLLTMGMARRVHHRFSDQILDLAHAANAISARQDYSIRAVRRSDDEIGILIDTFNHMITQIELRNMQLKSEVKRAQAAKIAKAQFLATMSHEIRTPINGILGMTELLLDTSLSREQNEFGVTILKSAENLLAVINDVLDFSKGEAGRVELENIPFSLTELIDESIDTVSIVACEKGLELCCQMASDVPLNLRGDPARIRQVLLNLLSNALKFTDKGEIIVRVMLERDRGEEVEMRFEVQDSGIGIPKDRIDRLFKSFSQVDASNNRQYGGSGLGLAICKQIVEAMGGSIYVNTEDGQGSTFGFRISFQKEASVEIESGPPTGRRILIADGNDAIRKSLEGMLTEDNEVRVVRTGAQARECLIAGAEKDSPFDLLLMDSRLVDGFRRGDYGAEGTPPPTPLVLLAPVNNLAIGSDLKWNGRSACIAKPLKRRDLFWCLSEILIGDHLADEGPFEDEELIEAPLPKRGAFEEYLEKVEPEFELAPEEEDREEEFSNVRVLVAEDHPVNQKITTRYLDKLGISWELAQNGEEAVKAVKEQRFDLVLMDVQMPVMDGLEATLIIRQHEEETGAHVPIVAMTAAVLAEDRRQAEKAGFDDYLPKPVRLNDLRDNLAKWIGDRRAAA